jgi:hypothetical protein
MTEPYDSLETELSSLRPQEVSRGLRARIAERLAEAPPATRRRWLWLALACGLAAACLAAVLLWGRGGRPPEREQPVVPRPAPPAPVEKPEPSLLDYQRALSRSPEELDALLNLCEQTVPEPDEGFVSIRAFRGSEAALYALLGED